MSRSFVEKKMDSNVKRRKNVEKEEVEKDERGKGGCGDVTNVDEDV